MKTLTIKWQRLLSDGQTCPRCGSTEAEVEKAVTVLGQTLKPLSIEVVLEKGDQSALLYYSPRRPFSQVKESDPG